MASVFINGRFLTQRTTGVQRYAVQTLLALDHLLGESSENVPSFTVLAPVGTTAPRLRTIRFRTVGPLRGNAWEQLTLPVAARGGLLLSFAPTGPILKRNQLVTIHDAAVRVVPDAFSVAFRTWYSVLMPALVRRTQRVMTVSEFSRGELVRHFGADPSRTLVTGEGWQHALEPESDPSVLAAHGLKKGRYVLAVSSPARHKNFAVILRAARHLRDPDVDVVVAGAIDNSVFGASALDGSERCKRVGYVDDRQLRALYENAGCFIYPSLYEGFGIPPLEAMALGCPVLAARSAALPEVCGEAALYFDPEDERGLARLIETVLSDARQRESLASHAAARLSAYSWKACAQRHLSAVCSQLGADSNLTMVQNYA